MTVLRGTATETQDPRGSQTRLLEGGRFSVPPKIAPACRLLIGAGTTTRLMASCSRSPRRRMMINPSRHPFPCLTLGVHSTPGDRSTGAAV
jgi:hypothetical protein